MSLISQSAYMNPLGRVDEVHAVVTADDTPSVTEVAAVCCVHNVVNFTLLDISFKVRYLLVHVDAYVDAYVDVDYLHLCRLLT